MDIGPMVSMADVAQAAGVHQTTVSRALRNDRRISAAKRRQIRALADKLGYRPHPLISALVAVRRQRRPPRFEATIAYVASVQRDPTSDDLYIEGARSAVARLGYRLDVFRLGEEGLTAPRLNAILRARNVYGLIIGALARRGENFVLSWRQYCIVTIEYTFSRPEFDRVVHDCYAGMRDIMQACRRAGRRRVGLLLSIVADERTERLFSAAYGVEQAADAFFAPIPPLIQPDWDEAAFAIWRRRYRPEVIVTSNAFLPQVQAWCDAKGIVIGRDVHLANVNTFQFGRIAGVAQNPRVIGAAAARMVVDKILNNDRGIPAVRLTVLTPGRWMNGSSFCAKRGSRERA
ncbi:MAG: LacI family DNA-binding transcriptional regulator [Opitutaceae bacterium]